MTMKRPEKSLTNQDGRHIGQVTAREGRVNLVEKEFDPCVL